jgi:hypothetical protein
LVKGDIFQLGSPSLIPKMIFKLSDSRADILLSHHQIV